jgi:hypothetical protein
MDSLKDSSGISKKWLNGLWVLLTLLAAFLTVWTFFRNGRKKEPGTDQERLMKALTKRVEDLKLRELMYRQAMHETGNLKSNIFTQNNNLYGMRPAIARPTTNAGAQGGYAYYNTLEDSIDDLLLWFKSIGEPVPTSSVFDYATWLREHGYYEAPVIEYAGGMNKVILPAA